MNKIIYARNTPSRRKAFLLKTFTTKKGKVYQFDLNNNYIVLTEKEFIEFFKKCQEEIE